MNNQSSITYFGKNNITLADTDIVADEIKIENTKRPHMIEHDSQFLYNCTHEYGGIVARDGAGKLAGFIKLNQIDEDKQVYEMGSLIVREEYRGKGIARNLIKSMVQSYSEIAMIIVTNVPAIIGINSDKSLGQIEVLLAEVPEKLQEIIAGPQGLLTDDRIYINHALLKNIQSGVFDSMSFIKDSRNSAESRLNL